MDIVIMSILLIVVLYVVGCASDHSEINTRLIELESQLKEVNTQLKEVNTKLDRRL